MSKTSFLVHCKHRFLKRLPKLDADKHVSAFDAETVLWSVAEHADCVAEGEIAPEDLLEQLSIPGVPDGVDWENYEGWIAGKVRVGIEEVAKTMGEDPEELLWYATDGARRDVIGKEGLAKGVISQRIRRVTDNRLSRKRRLLRKRAAK